jgi:hypothetical protein
MGRWAEGERAGQWERDADEQRESPVCRTIPRGMSAIRATRHPSSRLTRADVVMIAQVLMGDLGRSQRNSTGDTRLRSNLQTSRALENFNRRRHRH